MTAAEPAKPDPPVAPKATVRMSDAEIWSFVRDAHTGVFTTLRADGSPVSLPVWYALVERTVYMHTRGKKVVRCERNPTSSFLVEDGERWAELRAVHLSGRAEVVVPTADLEKRIGEEMERKYSRFRTEASKMPAATRSAYHGMSLVAFNHSGRILNWDNSHLGAR